MKRRVLLILVGTLAVVVAVGAIVVHRLEQNHVERRGSVYVAIEGRDIHWWPFAMRSHMGVGVAGRLGLVRGKCVGFVSRSGAHDDDGTIIVWPAGTTFQGSGRDLRITSEGQAVAIGDDIDGGNDFGHDLSGIKQHLPKECRDLPLLRVGLNE